MNRNKVINYVATSADLVMRDENGKMIDPLKKAHDWITAKANDLIKDYPPHNYNTSDNYVFDFDPKANYRFIQSYKLIHTWSTMVMYEFVRQDGAIATITQYSTQPIIY